MDSRHGNPSPSDPMESVCRHFPPPPQLYFAAYLQSLSQTDTLAARWTLATATRLHRIRWSPFADFFHPLLNYTLLHIYKVSCELIHWQPDGLLPRQPVSIGSDGVRLPTFYTPSSTILCCIYTKSLVN